MKIDISTQLITRNRKQDWNRLVSHPLQSWQWGHFREIMGARCLRIGLFKNQNLIQGWSVFFHKLPYLPYTVGYFPKGPEITKFMLKELHKYARQQNAIYIQIEPNVQNINSKTQNFKPFRLNNSHHPLFPDYTFILNLTKSEDELLKLMHPKTRYNIKIAQKHGVLIREDNSPNAFNTYLKLLMETVSRQKFFAHNQNYHKNLWQSLKTDKIARLWSASYKNQIIAAWMIFAFNDTIYYPYGASSRNYRQVMASNLLMWEIIKWSKTNGFSYFDMWGALGPNPDPEDPWYGFHKFKMGYGGDLVRWVGSYDLIINPILYPLFVTADKIRWTALNVKKFFINN